jgi:hypothetical protein
VIELFLELNDLINSVLEKYNCFEKGEPITPSVIDIKKYIDLLLIEGMIRKRRMQLLRLHQQKWDLLI